MQHGQMCWFEGVRRVWGLLLGCLRDDVKCRQDFRRRKDTVEKGMGVRRCIMRMGLEGVGGRPSIQPSLAAWVFVLGCCVRPQRLGMDKSTHIDR